MTDTTVLNWLEAAPAQADGFASLRESAKQSALALGLPVPRTEAWKFTNLTSLKALQPVAASTETVGEPVPAFDDLNAVTLHLSNGELKNGDAVEAPEGVEIVDLASASLPVWAARELGSIVETLKDSAFVDLNTVGFKCGVAICVQRGKMIERPLLLHIHNEADSEPSLSSPRVLVIVEDGASANLVEVHTGSGQHISNSVVEVSLGADARFGHYKLQADALEAFNLSATAVRAERNAVYDNFVLSTGSALARNEIRGHLAGEHVEYRINGAYLAKGSQHLDTTTFIDHAVANCESHEMYKGVLTDQARGVFQGKILVRPDAQKTDGYQMNRALMLSPDAEINSKPELEIYADDVKCSHGATVGELEEDHLFYLMARGISRERARALLVEAYVDETLDQIQNEAIRDCFKGIAADWMAQHVSGDAA